MLGMRGLRPRGIIATVVRRLELFVVPWPQVMIVTNDMRLGGAFSPNLIGPTPAGLAQGMGAIPPAGWPNGVGDELPFGTRNIIGSLNSNNWRV